MFPQAYVKNSVRGGGMQGEWGMACVVKGVCMVKGRGVCAWQGACMAGGHACQGACMGDMHGGYIGGMCGGGCAWQGHAWQERQPLQWTVRILLECILV